MENVESNNKWFHQLNWPMVIILFLYVDKIDTDVIMSVGALVVVGLEVAERDICIQIMVRTPVLAIIVARKVTSLSIAYFD